jgi:regulator of protease activity HflC (stomatin/prohibitin superfamily)
MIAFKYMLFLTAAALFVTAAAIVLYDLWLGLKARQAVSEVGEAAEPDPVRWRTTVALAVLAWIPILLAVSIAVVPSGSAGVRVSQISGTEPGTLYPGSHFVKPFIEHVEIFDIRDKLFTTGMAEGANDKTKHEPMRVQAKEGLTLGLATTVRYQLDPRRLDYIQSHLPQPVETELVPPVVASTWRELAPNYSVREIFSTARELLR